MRERLAACLVLLATPAAAMPFPEIDVSHACFVAVADFRLRLRSNSGEDRMTYCKRSTQQDVDRLRASWDKVGDRVHRQCRDGLGGSVTSVTIFDPSRAADCIEKVLNERRAAEQKFNEAAELREAYAAELREVEAQLARKKAEP